MGKGEYLDPFFLWDKSKDRLIQQVRPELVILFGSWAKGFEAEESDVDLLVVSTAFQGLKLHERKRLVWETLGWDLPMDILCHTPSEFEAGLRENPFIAKIIKEGTMLFEKPEEARKAGVVHEPAVLLCRTIGKVQEKLSQFEGPRRKKDAWLRTEFWPFLKKVGGTSDWASLLFYLSALYTESEVRGTKGSDDLRATYLEVVQKERPVLDQPDRELLKIMASLPRVDTLLPLSSVMRFTFSLVKPYISRDDESFYIIDNPVRKDKVFKVPMVAPSSWKGNLRWAATKQLAEWWQGLERKEQATRVEEFVERRLRLAHLFGNEKGVDIAEEREAELETYLDEVGGYEAAHMYRARLKEVAPTSFLAGRLRFFPTFFEAMGLEVINPHDRETGAGTLPIYFETVPAGAHGAFTLLHVPFDLVGQPTEVVKAAVKADLPILAEVVEAMFCTYGFSAKKTSGFGVTEPEVTGGQWQVSYWIWKEKPEQKALVSEPITDLKKLKDVAQRLAAKLDKEEAGG